MALASMILWVLSPPKCLMVGLDSMLRAVMIAIDPVLVLPSMSYVLVTALVALTRLLMSM